MVYDPQKHHRRSIRLKGYDYSQQGAYFVTICNKGRHCFFGEVIDQSMILNDAGIMVDKWVQELPNKFPDIKCDVWQVMPNHFHAIIINNGNPVGADLCVGPNNAADVSFSPNNSTPKLLGEHKGSPLYRVIQWFKTMTTNEYIRGVKNAGWPEFNGKLWQRNYWEHIIRDQKSYDRIAQYIINNPANWDTDRLKGADKEPN
ncbi:MAG: transposase [Imperialibacter sp.]|uniref:transposase n=1 Tax=Imperialibacter sp. TaxID=2038411 RepID=UPI0032EB7AA1